MILAKMTLRPFAGMASREIALSPRLNLVLGPNEAGKTTVFQALRAALFTRTDLPPSRFEKEMRRFLPVGSGDTVSVELEFVAGSGAYVLKKRWGVGAPSGRAAPGRTELLFPDGSVLTKEDEVSAEIERQIGVGEGTCRSVLMSSQAGLTQTLEDLKGSGADTLHSLGDVLRRSILETDGISVDRFRSLVEEGWAEHWSRWDAAADGPEKGRGIGNPYTKGVGLVLAAYYKKETLGAALKGAREHEEKLDSLNRELAALSGSCAAVEKYLAENRAAAEAAQARKEARLKLEAAGSRTGELKEANKRWPVLLNGMEENRARAADAEKRAAAFRRELEGAQGETKSETARAAFGRVFAARKKLDERRGELAETKTLTGDDLEAIQDAHAASEKIRVSREAGGFGMRLLAKKETKLEIYTDDEPRVGHGVKSGETLSFEARRRVRIESPDWELEASSLPLETEPEDGRPEETLKGLFAKHGIGSLKEAFDANRAYEMALSGFREAGGALALELGGRSFEEAEAERASLGEPAVYRDIAAIHGDLEDARTDAAGLSAEVRTAERACAELARRYGDQDKLLLLVSENVRAVTELEKTLAELPPLPEGAADEGTFITAYETKKKERDDLREKARKLEIEIARLEGHAPELSSEELEAQLAEAETEYARVRARGAAVSKIRELSAAILAEIDRSTYDGMRRRLEEYVASLTGGRYTKVRMRESVPEGFLRRDGALLEYSLLSTGTKDMLALALRLAMAGYFLEGRDGFVIMDDPFANLDPDRQKRAAEAVRSFAETRQLILFSCHPSAAEILGVAPILL
jgi:DNA repair protein SbcC/Rad50